MIKLYITDIDGIDLKRADEIDAQRAERLKRYRLESDKKRCLAGGLFIKRFLGDTEIKIGTYGKPEAENGMHFNLSHSGKYVLFALSDSKIGCDIEMIKEVEPERLGKLVFCPAEMASLEHCDNKNENFFRLWTRKESLLKCIGEGFHRSSKSVDASGESFTDNGTTYYMSTWLYNGYTVSVCSTEGSIPNTIEYIKLCGAASTGTSP